MAHALREYQADAIDAVMGAIAEGHTRIMYTAATGLGKTRILSGIVQHLLDDPFSEHRILLLAHRIELITQMFTRVKFDCNISDFEIGIELAGTHASKNSRVIVGSIQTLAPVKGRADRLEGWRPTVLVVDECHRAASATYHRLFDALKVGTECIHIGCTATAKRTDRLSLCSYKIDGNPVLVEDKKTGKKRPVLPSETVYDRHVYDYTMYDGIENGYLVPVVGHTVRTDTDISGVKMGADGDFADGELAKAIDNAKRTVAAINAWKEHAADRSTIVFCATVAHAHHSAQLWRDAGFDAEALDGETNSWDRNQTLTRFKNGKLQVLVNCALFIEGMDAPICSCVVHLKPTTSWLFYVQASGRGVRTLDGVINAEMSKEERLAAIVASAKPNCIIFDVVDISTGKDLCAVPNIIELPVSIDLEGHSVTDAKKLLDKFEEVRDRVIGECPVNYRELEVIVEKVELIRKSAAKNHDDWAATHEGFTLKRKQPGYTVNLFNTDNPEQLRLSVRKGEEVLIDKIGRPDRFKQYLEKAAHHATQAITAHSEMVRAATPRGTLDRLSPRQIGCLKANGHPLQQIDCMPYAKAKALIDRYMQAWKETREA